MNQQALSSFIWSVADLLRGDYKQSDYGKVILPFTVLRRLDCVMAAHLFLPATRAVARAKSAATCWRTISLRLSSGRRCGRVLAPSERRWAMSWTFPRRASGLRLDTIHT